MNEIKPVSIRISEEDQGKFKEYAVENGISQADAFASMIGLLELEKAKSTLGDRAKSIEVFRETTTKLVNFYLNSLEENITTEDRIRDEMSKELKVKDDTILNFMQQLDELKISDDLSKEKIDKFTNDIETLKDMLNKANNDISDKQSNIEKLNSSNDLLQENLKEYKGYRETNKELQEELSKCNVNNTELLDKYRTLENINKQLEDKIKNHDEMIDFFKSNNIELKTEMKDIQNKHIKEIDDLKKINEMLQNKYEKQIEMLKVQYQENLKEQIDNIEEKFKNKYSIELDKKDLEIEKLKNKLPKEL